MSDRLVLPTGVSAAFWCNAGGIFERATWQAPDNPKKRAKVAWLDHLLVGGLVLPNDQSEALTVLITGPPGAGKSVLAMELCHRWSLMPEKGQPQLLPDRPSGLYCFYISFEAAAPDLKRNANDFGWERAEAQFEIFERGKANNGVVTILGKDSLSKYMQPEKPQLHDMVRGMVKDWQGIQEKYGARVAGTPDILVIDGLNIVHDPTTVSQVFNEILQVTATKPRVLILIRDAGADEVGHQGWDYVCDVVLQLDRSYAPQYMLRSIEVIKARWQEHRLGKHQVKIYAGPRAAGKNVSDPGKTEKELTGRRRAHPFRNEGGIFIFPSIHYYLSAYKRAGPSRHPALESTPLESWNNLLSEGTNPGGLPKGRCTALIGERGGHKSHLGYFHLLGQVVPDVPGGSGHGKALVVSLRDDEGMARKTMSNILLQQFNENVREFVRDDHNRWKRRGQRSKRDWALKFLSSFEDEKKDELEILYYPPGYITPEEFFHRLFLSIRRLKQDNRPVTLLFNSLDQLPARFPLCASEGIFVPGLIEMLVAEGITSIFVAVNEPGQPEEQYGLLPMADLVLEFGYQTFFKKWHDWLLTPDRKEDDFWNLKLSEREPEVSPVVMKVRRMPGGHTAGKRAVLDLISSPDQFNRNAGIHLTQVPDWFRFPAEQIGRSLLGR